MDKPTETEEFRTIPGYTRYKVSNLGRVMNQRGMVLRDYAASGYRQINLQRDDGVRGSLGVHRAVARAFLGEIPLGQWVNHRDGDRANNRVENLEFGNPVVPAFNFGRLTQESAEAIRDLFKNGWSQHRLAAAFSVSQPTIHDVVTNKTWRAYGEADI